MLSTFPKDKSMGIADTCLKMIVQNAEHWERGLKVKYDQNSAVFVACRELGLLDISESQFQ